MTDLKVFRMSDWTDSSYKKIFYKNIETKYSINMWPSTTLGKRTELRLSMIKGGAEKSVVGSFSPLNL